MSKIYKKYLELKSNPISNSSNTLYLFKSGIFFIFIADDALIVSKLLGLKLSNLNDSIVKCGFPVNSLQKYLSMLQNTQYKVEIISFLDCTHTTTFNYMFNSKVESTIHELLNVKIDDLSVRQAYDFLYRYDKIYASLP